MDTGHDIYESMTTAHGGAGPYDKTAAPPHRVPPSPEFRVRRRFGEGGVYRRRTRNGWEAPRQRLSLPRGPAAARPASRRATGMRNGEQET
ncbi:hypothetical protein JCM13580A_45400 [Streptomyces drozdowiczii]